MTEKEFGAFITKLIAGKDLTREEAMNCVNDIVRDEQNDMQQGAFLAALTAKGASATEIAAVWQIIYELDTVRVGINTTLSLVDNCGTGMDSIKTFNISTIASVIAAADSVVMAKHGARAITSQCGTIDILEELGVNVECPPEVVKKSIEAAGIGIFNGMSTLVHPKALSRILSKISFGTVLNIAASLANPTLPKLAVRGVYNVDMLVPTANTMKEIGYERALVVYGEGENGIKDGIDEASTMGCSHICELTVDGQISQYKITPEQLGIKRSCASDLMMDQDKSIEARRFKNLLQGQETQARTDIVCLNAGLILYVAGRETSIKAGYERALELISTNKPLVKLQEWISVQQ